MSVDVPPAGSEYPRHGPIVLPSWRYRLARVPPTAPADDQHRALASAKRKLSVCRASDPVLVRCGSGPGDGLPACSASDAEVTVR
jgi:hypothetical protein